MIHWHCVGKNSDIHPWTTVSQTESLLYFSLIKMDLLRSTARSPSCMWAEDYILPKKNSVSNLFKHSCVLLYTQQKCLQRLLQNPGANAKLYFYNWMLMFLCGKGGDIFIVNINVLQGVTGVTECFLELKSHGPVLRTFKSMFIKTRGIMANRVSISNKNDYWSDFYLFPPQVQLLILLFQTGS